jgi:colanic acid biosynthesis glycosyl transferase WcaI
MVVEPPLFCAPTTLITAWLCRARSLLHVQDFEVDAAFDLGILSSSWLRNIVLKVETFIMRKFDRVSTISAQMMLRLGDKGVQSAQQVFFPNWVDTDYIFPTNTENELRKQLEIPRSNIVFLYSGNMGEKQGLEIIIEAAQRLSGNKTIKFVMCGNGAAYPRLRRLAEGLDNIHWLPLQPLDKLNELLNMADVHLLPQKADVADLVMPSKLTGMLASGKPVLATAHGGTQVANVLESIGVVVPPENTDEFTNAILDLDGNAERRNQLGKKARDYAVEYLATEAILIQFEENLKKISK